MKLKLALQPSLGGGLSRRSGLSAFVCLSFRSSAHLCSLNGEGEQAGGR